MTQKDVYEMLIQLNAENREKILTLVTDLLRDQQSQREPASDAPV
ncbi:unknown [Firmicutes bacterium CAG:110]|nr:unknown [Firmicutes bacterium CAG:110]